MATVPVKSSVADHEEQHRLTAVQGLAALSLDALSSVAYGPEAILVVLVAAGATALHYSLPITGAIVVLLAVLVVSYRQVMAPGEAVPAAPGQPPGSGVLALEDRGADGGGRADGRDGG